MKLNKLIPATLALAALAAAIPAAAKHEQGEAKLAKLLDGRVAGAPVHCLSSSQRRDMQVVDKTALVFKYGDTIYVNASWLVALAAIETAEAGAHRPTLQPAALRGTPYRTYDTLAACTNDVTTRCGTCVASGVSVGNRAPPC